MATTSAKKADTPEESKTKTSKSATTKTASAGSAPKVEATAAKPKTAVKRKTSTAATTKTTGKKTVSKDSKIPDPSQRRAQQVRNDKSGEKTDSDSSTTPKDENATAADGIAKTPTAPDQQAAHRMSQDREFIRSQNNNRRGNQNRGRNNRGRRQNGAVPVQNGNNRGKNFSGQVDGRWIPDAGLPTEVITGILDMKSDGNGVLRRTFSGGEGDAYISGSQIRRFRLRPGDTITGPARHPKDNEQYWGLLKVETVNGRTPEEMQRRIKFRNLTPVYPDQKIVLETTNNVLTTRMIDLVAPVGRGQRGMIVSPPKAGKTTAIKDIATGIATNYPDMHLMAVLVGERPEEVTDIRRHIAAVTNNNGEVAASNFDEQATEQVRVSELALEKAKRMVELGKHVVILLDSITRLARAYNLAMPTSGRTLSGGFDPAALYPPKKFFGAARNFEEFDTLDGKNRASLTILGTALTETGSRMDDLIYEEFKGTGNMELHLDRALTERRIYPAIDVMRSGTRREDLLFDNNEYQSVIMMRRMLDMLDQRERTSVIVSRMKDTKTNKEFLASLKEG